MSATVGLFSLQQAANYYSIAKETVKARWVYYTLLATSTLAGALATHLLFKAFAWDIKVIAISTAILALVTFVAYRVLKRPDDNEPFILDNKEQFNTNKLKADEGDLNARLLIGKMYYKGVGAEKDDNEALKYFKLAGKQHSPEAYFYIGKIYESQGDCTKALNYYLKAKALDYAPAIYHIGVMYEKGISLTPNSVRASQYYDLAKSLGYSQA